MNVANMDTKNPFLYQFHCLSLINTKDESASLNSVNYSPSKYQIPQIPAKDLWINQCPFSISRKPILKSNQSNPISFFVSFSNIKPITSATQQEPISPFAPIRADKTTLTTNQLQPISSLAPTNAIKPVASTIQCKPISPPVPINASMSNLIDQKLQPLPPIVLSNKSKPIVQIKQAAKPQPLLQHNSRSIIKTTSQISQLFKLSAIITTNANIKFQPLIQIMSLILRKSNIQIIILMYNTIKILTTRNLAEHCVINDLSIKFISQICNVYFRDKGGGYYWKGGPNHIVTCNMFTIFRVFGLCLFIHS